MSGNQNSNGSSTPVQDWPVEDRRAHERYADQSHLRAVNSADGMLLGEIQDISLGGARMKLDCTLPRRGTYAMRIDIRMDGEIRSPIHVTARNVWMHSVDLEKVTYAGFVFIDLSDQARAQIEAIFAECRE